MNLLQTAHTPRSDVIVASNTCACHHAFSSGSISPSKRLARRCHAVRVSKQRTPQIVYAAAATDVGTKAVQAIKKSVGGDIFVAGGNGQLAARIVQELLRNGFKVTAGVSDIEEAQAGLDFAKRFEIIKGSETKNIKLQAVDLSDESAITDALPRNARVLVAVGDSLGGQKADGRLVDRALSAAVGKGARQFILVTPLGGGAANPIGFLGNLFGGGSSKKPSKIEQQVAESGLDFVIVRTAKTDGEAPPSDTGVSVTPQGNLTSNSTATKSQVAEVVAQVLLQAQTDVLVEVAGDPSSPPQGVDSAVAQALPNCSIAEAEQQTGDGADQEEEQQQASSPTKGGGGPFGRTQAVKAQPPEDDKEEGKGASGGGLFGGRSKAAADAPTGPQKQKKVSAKLVDAKPVGKERGGFGQIRGSKQQQPEEEEEEEETTPQNPLGGLFGFGAKKAKAKAQQASPTVEGARKAASKGAAAKGRQGKSAVKQAGAAASNGAGQSEKKKGGFLQALGLGQENVYADDDK